MKFLNKEINNKKTDIFCCCCGNDINSNEIVKQKDVIKNTFTEHTKIINFNSHFFCQNCAKILNPENRRKHIFIGEDLQYKFVDKNFILNFLFNIQDYNKYFILSISQTFKKHHLLNAGLSSKYIINLGTDNKTITINDVPFFIKTLKLINKALFNKITKNEILNNIYSNKNLIRFKSFIEELEKHLIEYRNLNKLQIILNLITKDLIIEDEILEEELIILNSNEILTINFLKNLALASDLRKSEGIDFWNFKFKNILTKTRKKDFIIFINNLMRDLKINNDTNLIEFIENLSFEDKEVIKQEIELKSNFLIAYIFNLIKKENKNKNKNILLEELDDK